MAGAMGTMVKRARTALKSAGGLLKSKQLRGGLNKEGIMQAGGAIKKFALSPVGKDFGKLAGAGAVGTIGTGVAVNRFRRRRG